MDALAVDMAHRERTDAEDEFLAVHGNPYHRARWAGEWIGAHQRIVAHPRIHEQILSAQELLAAAARRVGPPVAAPGPGRDCPGSQMILGHADPVAQVAAAAPAEAGRRLGGPASVGL